MIRAGLRGLGEVLITVGLVLLLFVAYQLGWTNYQAGRSADRVAEDLRASWRVPAAAAEGEAEAGGGAGTGPRAADFGRGFAFLHIPRLGTRWSTPVVEGVDLAALATGVGHYPDTARPGAVGNFALAGHRATNGEPFADLDQLRAGDLVVAETRRRWFTYQVDSTRIVTPASTWVLDPVPGSPGAAPTEALLTLTTCNPRWASYERLIVFGHLVERRPRSQGQPSALVRSGGGA